MDNNLRFEEFFTERARERGFSPKKLSEVSGVPLKHVEALARGDFQNLPPAPYFRGYLVKLGQVLEFDHEMWWRKLKDSGFAATSGAKDEMPKNRFVTKVGSKILWVIVIVIAIVAYFYFQIPHLLGTPGVTIISPAENPAVSPSQNIVISGLAENASELKINGEKIPLSANGAWEKEILLHSGLNSFEISASKFLGGETREIQQIIYEMRAVTTTTGGAELN